MLVLHFLSAVTTELDAAVEYPVTGTPYQLTCKYEDTAITAPITYEWYKGGVKVENEVAQTYGATDDGSYNCIAVDKDSKKSAATPAKTLTFHGKYFLIHYLNHK